jgi:quinoprotein glucose dehydrogenase
VKQRLSISTRSINLQVAFKKIKSTVTARPEYSYANQGMKMRRNIRIIKGGLLWLLVFVFSSAVVLAVSGETHSMVQWPFVGGDQNVDRYSPLDDINTTNVGQLQMAWEWKSPDKLMPEYKVIPGAFGSTGIMIDNVVYVTTNLNRVAALDADTGQEKWVYDPHSYEAGMPALAGGFRHRGVAAWRDHGKLRIFLGTRYKLISLDGETGKPVSTFGAGGTVDATVGLSRMTDNAGNPIDKNFLEFNAAPTVYKDLVIMGTATGDRVYGKDPGGAVRAFDARTGKLVWSFHMIPQPGEFGNDTWPTDEWKTVGSTDVWPGVTVDEKRGLVYVPGGNPTNSYYGGKRIGNTLYAQTLVCLDANTGKRKWHFQTVHHDLWDLDLPTQPNLVTITKDGKKIDAVVQVGKQGLIFAFDRVTGDPIWPIVEQPVPQSDVPGEVTSATQPIPTKPPPVGFNQGVSLDDANDLTPEIKAAALEQLKKYRTGPLYMPPSLQGTFNRDIANWGGAAFDPETGWMYIKTNNGVGVLKLVASDSPDNHNPFKDVNVNVGYESGGAPGAGSVMGGIPITKPPYGGLTAVNLNTGEIVWKVPVGKGSKRIRDNPALNGIDVPDLGVPGFGGVLLRKAD